MQAQTVTLPDYPAKRFKFSNELCKQVLDNRGNFWKSDTYVLRLPKTDCPVEVFGQNDGIVFCQNCIMPERDLFVLKKLENDKI